MLLKIMTFNIRGSIFDKDKPNAWEKRAELNIAVIRGQAPDLIGFQECHGGNLLTYQQHLSDYARLLGPSILPEEKPRAYNAIFWHPERLSLLDSGSFWLSETPEVTSRSWNTASPRLAIWAKFRLADGRELFHLNTHLDHISAEARVRGVELIAQRLRDLQATSAALIVTGDFNCNPDDSVHETLQTLGLTDAYLITGHEDNEYSNTFHAYGWSKPSSSGAKRRGSMRIDWILFSDPTDTLRLISCEIIRDAQPPVYPSDHYPVVAEFEV